MGGPGSRSKKARAPATPTLRMTLPRPTMAQRLNDFRVASLDIRCSRRRDLFAFCHAQGLALSFVDATALFAVMVGIALVPISIGGWGLRELAVVSLLGGHGASSEKALIFSVCFGLVLIVGSLPGALVWMSYPIPRPTDG